MDHGGFYGDFISITETAPSEAYDHLYQDYTSHAHSVCTGAVC